MMKGKEYQNVVVDIILFSEDSIRTSADNDETERIPFYGLSSEPSFVD